jgi:superfamily II DNA or RNA helicase
MLIIDEYHVAAADQMSQVFKCVKYKLILGLTATFERLDGKHKMLEQYAPIIDKVSTIEALANDWISEYKEYQVLIEVDDIEEYKALQREWLQHFEFFQYSFDIAMKMAGPEGWKAKLAYRDELYKGNDESKKKEILQVINFHSAGFMRTMTKRKAFINNHPKKIEIAKKIMEARPNAKIITFSNNVKMAEALENGEYVYTGKTSKKRASDMVEKYLSGQINHLHSCKKLIEGFNDPNTSVAIILGMDSSERRAVQTRGRVVRKTTNNKQAEIFNIVIRFSQEEKWFKDSHKKSNYLTIDEKGLDQVLRGETPDLYRPKLGEIMFRF